MIAPTPPDPMGPDFDEAAVTGRLRSRRTAIKRALLDQSLVSGIGNIYADESLWRARLHGARRTAALSRPRLRGLLCDVRTVLAEAVAAGGTSFDALYVNVNGQSGYFSRTLAVYGRAGLPCLRCGTAVRRVAFMNRSSYFCPRCQRPPRLWSPHGRGVGELTIRYLGATMDRPAARPIARQSVQILVNLPDDSL